MKTTEYIWQNGEFKKWHEATTHVLSHTLHYSGGAFEGIRAYKTKEGSSIFKLEEHVDRLLYSAKSISMDVKYSRQEICDIILGLLEKNKMVEGYIRPLFYYGYKKLGLNPTGCPVELVVACWPWDQYLADSVDVKTSKYIRIHPKSTISDAKLCGHYLNSQLASLELQGTKYHEALLLDVDGFVAEGPGENIFIVKDNKLSTPKLGNILGGITRQVVIDMARDSGYSVEEKNLTLDDVYTAEEAFFTGTAVEVTAIRSLDDHVINDGAVGPVTALIKDKYYKLVRNSADL